MNIRFFLKLLLSGLFLWAGVMKAVHPSLFFGEILSYRLLPESLAAVLAWYLPWLEIVLALSFLSSRFEPASWTGLFSLMTLFTLALLSVWVRGLDITLRPGLMR